MNNNTDSKTVQKRIRVNKDKILEQLSRVPIVQVACSQAGIGRASYYRWRKEDKEFAKAADEALYEGKMLVTDMAESQLISAIKERNLTAIIFWLKNHNPTYGEKVQLTHRTEKEELSAEQRRLIKKAIALTQGNKFKGGKDG